MTSSPSQIDKNSQTPVKVACPVQLGLVDGRTVDALIHLLGDVNRPGGVTSIESVLDGPREFIPAQIHGSDVLLSRSSVRTVSLDATAPGAGELPDLGGSLDVVTLKLDSGETISGILRYMAPAETMRMSDVFNHSGRFLALRVGDKIVLVSKAHLVLASF